MPGGARFSTRAQVCAIVRGLMMCAPWQDASLFNSPHTDQKHVAVGRRAVIAQVDNALYTEDSQSSSALIIEQLLQQRATQGLPRPASLGGA